MMMLVPLEAANDAKEWAILVYKKQTGVIVAEKSVVLFNRIMNGANRHRRSRKSLSGTQWMTLFIMASVWKRMISIPL